MLNEKPAVEDGKYIPLFTLPETNSTRP